MYDLEDLTPERCEELWVQLKPMIQSALNECQGELDAEDLKLLHNAGIMTIFVELLDGKVTMVLAFEFIRFPKYVTANVVALAGTGLHGSVERHWAQICKLLKRIGVHSIDAWCGDRMSQTLDRIMGFKKAYNHMRLPL